MTGAVFLGAEGILYTAFLALDLLYPGSGWDVPLKYLSIVLCFLWAWKKGSGPDGRLMTAALGFTLLADLFLLVLDRWYLAGVSAFCVVQVLYLVRIAKARPCKLPLRLTLRAALAAAALGGTWYLGALDPLTALSLCYFTLLAGSALECLIFRPPFPGFGLGLILFACCDVCVGLQNLFRWFPDAGGPLVAFARVGMWLFYLPAQVLLAQSVERK